MKYRQILIAMDKIKQTHLKLEKYYNEHYCGYMGEWVPRWSEKEYNKMQDEYQEFLDSEIELL